MLCSECGDAYCDECFKKLHARGKRSTHLSQRIGENARPILDLMKDEVARARHAFESAVKVVSEIRASGYPELSCPGIERHKAASLAGVPVISGKDLQLFQADQSIGDVIGEGAFAQVHRIEVPNAGVVAFKRFKSGVNVELMRREAEAIFKLRHPNVVQLLGICLDAGLVGLVLELVEGGSLASLIYTSPSPTRFDKNKALCVLRSICIGLDFIHSQNQLHLDVKASNVLVSRDLTVVKLSDFGASQELRETLAFLTKAPELTLRWASPERLHGVAKLTAGADVYSVAMVLLEMLSGAVPFSHVPDLKVSGLVLRGDPPADLDDLEDEFSAELMRACWQSDPALRPTAAQLVQRVVSELTRECLVCCEPFSLSAGLECNCTEGTHFICAECLADSMRCKLESSDVRAVPPEGYVACAAKRCHGVLTVERLHEAVAPSLLVAWTGVSAANKLAQVQFPYFTPSPFPTFSTLDLTHPLFSNTSPKYPTSPTTTGSPHLTSPTHSFPPNTLLHPPRLPTRFQYFTSSPT